MYKNKLAFTLLGSLQSNKCGLQQELASNKHKQQPHQLEELIGVKQRSKVNLYQQIKQHHKADAEEPYASIAGPNILPRNNIVEINKTIP